MLRSHDRLRAASSGGRRDLRRRDPLGDPPGRQLQAPRQADLPHGAAAQPVRVARGQGDDPFLAHRRARRDRRRDPRARHADSMSVITSTWVERDGLLRSPLLERYHVVAGFTTRAQGSMAGSVFPLDEQERNRRTLARGLGFDAVARVRQVHGNTVVRLDRAAEPWPEGDALWTDRTGVLLGIAAADCVPILLVDPASGRVGAAHAGWQGTRDRKSTRLNSSHRCISYAVFCLKKKKKTT